MKVALVLALVLLMVLAGLPLAMGHMSEMGDCPACTAPSPFALGLCAGMLAVLAFIVLLGSRRIGVAGVATRQFLLATSIFRPPRTT